MKKNIAIFCIFLLPFCAFAQQGKMAEKQSNANLTAKILVGEIKAKMKSLPADQAVIEKEIAGDPLAHQKPDSSKTAVRKMMEKNFEDWYRSEVEKVLERVDADRPDGVSSWFGADVKEKFLVPPIAEIKGNLDASLGPVFDQARREAVRKQYSRLTVNTYPTEEEVETNQPETLKKILSERAVVTQTETLYQENQDEISTNVIEPVVNDAYVQFEAQKKIVASADGGVEVMPELIEQEINAQLGKSIDALDKTKAGQTGGPTKVYSIFSSVKSAIPDTAKKLAKAKFATALGQMAMIAKKEDIKLIILNDLPSHVITEESQKLVEAAYAASIMKLALDSYVKKVPADKQAALDEFVNDCANNDPACINQLQSLVKRSVAENFGLARDEVAQEQLLEFFEPLSSETWIAPPAEINRRSDLQAIDVLDPLAFEGITSQTFDKSKVLVETKKLAEIKIKKLLEEGLTAFHLQMALVIKVEQLLAEEIKQATELPAEEAFIEQFTAAVAAEWKKEKLFDKYSELFEKVAKEVTVRAKALLPREVLRREQVQEEIEKQKAEEEIEKQKAEEEKTEPPAEPQAAPSESDSPSDDSGDLGQGPEDGLGGKKEGGIPIDSSGKGVPTPPIPEVDFIPDMIIDLDVSSPGSVSAEIYLQGDLPEDFKSVKIPIVGDATDEQLEQIRQLFNSMLTRKVKDKYYVYMRVFSRQISYGTISDFRGCLQKIIKDIKDLDKKRNFSVSWFDELMKEKTEKGKTDVPDEIEFKGGDFSRIA